MSVMGVFRHALVKAVVVSLVGLLGLWVHAPRAGAELRFGVELGGGSVVDWGSPDETGNAFGGIVLLGIGDLGVGVGVAAAMPDSRLQGQFESLWVEGRYHFLGYGRFLSPYAVVGLGVAFEDAFAISNTGFVPARWSTSAGLLVSAGAGLRIGEVRGLSLSLDARALNHSHLGLQLLVGYTF